MARSRKTVRVKVEWIGEAIAINHEKGGCDFHCVRVGGEPHPECGCCLLAKAYLKAKGVKIGKQKT